jgi:LPXTG-site transpeptidase (sortase) family protein
MPSVPYRGLDAVLRWRGWSRLRLPLAGLCVAGGLASLGAPVWSGWWTARVQAGKGAAFQASLVSAQAAEIRAAPAPPVTGASAPPAALGPSPAPGPRDVAPGDVLAELQIPAAQVDSFVLEGLTYEPAVWESLLRQGPAHVAGTALPGQPGNAVIFGHRDIWGAVFAHLDALRPGDPVTVVTAWGTFRYQVTGSRTILATDFGAVAPRHDGPATLQLVTCDGLWDQSRRVVEARLVPQG